MTFRRRLYLTLEPTEKGGIIERIFEIFLVIIIVLNIIVILSDSVQEYHNRYATLFYRFEIFSVVFFTLEYVARIYSIVEKPGYGDPAKGRIKFAKSFMGIIDLLSFLPFYLAFLPLDLRFLRIFRLLAFFRMFKIARYLHALSIFRRVIHDRREQLVLTVIFILFTLIVISSIMFYVENDAQPDVFTSIPATMWWGVSTITTVGYGDMVPVTTAGKILSGMFAIVGFGLIALPAGILSSGFFEFIYQKKSRKCPHCGKDINDEPDAKR
ncbi:MAG: ion transporter [Flammeovirgaceae bacterium]|nr:ion transporter [Flammeovirgaceae bacterium]